MENNDLLIRENQDVLLRQNQSLEPAHSHSSCLVHGHNFELADINDHNLEVDDLGLVHTRDYRLVLDQTNEQDMIKQHSSDQDFDGENSVDVDQKHTNVEEHENQLAITGQSHGVGSPENHELAMVDYNDFLENQNMEIVPISAVNLQQTLEVRDLPVELTVGQEFPDVHSCRRAIRDAAIAFHFEMQTIKSDKSRFTAKCASKGCPWRIHAAKLPGVPTFSIRTIYKEHTCGGITHLGHLQASVQWVANSMEQRFRENPHYRPKEILKEIHRVHGITLSYKQAWRAKERFNTTIRGSLEKEFRLLLQYCDQVRRTNPGSIAVVYGNPEDNCFKRLFISFQASIYGFLNRCRPLIGLDRTLLKSKYLGTLPIATGFDGYGALFPLAFGVVDNENVDNWMWFLSELHTCLKPTQKTCQSLQFFLIDRRVLLME